MKNETILLVMFVLIGILPYTATATPGIITTMDPLSKTTVSGNMVSYDVIIINMDDSCAKEVTSLDMTDSQSGWTYTFSPNIIGQTIPAGNGMSISTVLSVTSPSGTANANYEHQLLATVEYEAINPITGETILIPDTSTGMLIPLMLPESDPENFNTQIQNTAPIPEFPTIALPVLTVIGLMFMFGRKSDMF